MHNTKNKTDAKKKNIAQIDEKTTLKTQKQTQMIKAIEKSP